jgi:uncharacterized protein with HEPN domain
MNRDDSYYLEHILEYAHKIQDLLKGKDRLAFDQDGTLRVTITHWLQIIGEAARRISESLQNDHPEIAWHPMVGMRNRIVHDYLGIDDTVVWETAHTRVPELITQLENLIQPHAGKNQ